MVEHQKLLVV